MDILGSIGKLYTFILLVILFLGSGLAVWAGINAIMNNKDKMKENSKKFRIGLNSRLRRLQNIKNIGGMNMSNNGFIKLAVFAFVGIIISAAILTMLPKYSNSMSNMNSQYGTSTMSMQGMNSSSQGGMSSSTDLYSIQQQLNNVQQQISQLQGQMNNSMNGMQNNSSSSINNNMNSNMNNSNMNSGSMNSNSSSGSMSMPMM